ncbi:TetR/AcrR family transcriptional regulator [Mesorhizobium sp. AR10]|uniref:TetR/AcrR family transcriptional regulator n=1 Tax=Mesorhizobium sp. AR10 TaxID=2865839 RepID=UPI0021601A0A|nr:TetR/AcrR family transcriptional regulator [Mesorhizobium sp. AR10]UVK38772.1 TetR/AcrR family transcriptional regulator [Mesorhizobium sp. AR10]
MGKLIVSKLAPSSQAASASGDRVALVPQRSNGRERVALILKAAADVIHERGYEATTMKEIAERSDTKIGSLYRFFPTKEVVADALLELYAGSLEAFWQAIIAKARSTTTEHLADLLLGFYVSTRKKHKALLPLLESRSDASTGREAFRARNLDRIAEALKAHAPHLRRPAVRTIAVIMLYNMRTMMALTFDPAAPNAPGAINELRSSVRAYLVNRLKPEG